VITVITAKNTTDTVTVKLQVGQIQPGELIVVRKVSPMEEARRAGGATEVIE